MRAFRLGIEVSAAWWLLSSLAYAQDVRDTSFVAPDGTRVLQQSIVVPATPRQLWDAFTTSEGLRSWAAPVVEADFRLGGVFESTYRVDGKIGEPGNIRNRYISFVPLKMVSIQAIAAPPTFKFAELLPEIFTVIEFTEVSPGQARVTISMVGYKQGEGYDTVYKHFEGGNAWSLRKLRERFVSGPVVWKKTAAVRRGGVEVKPTE